MAYGAVAEIEMEVTIRLDRAAGEARICSTWPAWSRRLERLFGSPKRVTEQEGKVVSAFWTVPLAAVRLRAGKRRQSPAQRAAAVKILKQAREGERLPGASGFPERSTRGL